MSVTITEFFMGRRETHPFSLTPAIEREASRTVDLANKLLLQAATFSIVVPINPNTRSQVSSGWRPAEINAATPNAAPNSKHMTGQAIDLYDPEGVLDDWLTTGEGQAAITALGLWMEHPSATKGWCHVQTVPPRSGRRVFYP